MYIYHSPDIFLKHHPSSLNQRSCPICQVLLKCPVLYCLLIPRALSTFHSEFEEAGHWRIPTLDKDKHSMRYRHYGYTDEDIANNMFVSGVFESMPAMSRMHWDRAQHYLKLIGWTITKPELRYFLVWDWG